MPVNKYEELEKQLRRMSRCRRCECLACDRDPAGELHNHVCTGEEGCVETRNKLLAARAAANIRLTQAADAIADLRSKLERASEPVQGPHVSADLPGGE